MSKQPHRHRSRELRKRREKKGAASTAALPRGKGIPVVIKGLTLSDIARALDIDQSYLSRITLGKAMPSYTLLTRLKDLLGCDSLDATVSLITGQDGQPEGR